MNKAGGHQSGQLIGLWPSATFAISAAPSSTKLHSGTPRLTYTDGYTEQLGAAIKHGQGIVASYPEGCKGACDKYGIVQLGPG